MCFFCERNMRILKLLFYIFIFLVISVLVLWGFPLVVFHLVNSLNGYSVNYLSIWLDSEHVPIFLREIISTSVTDLSRLGQFGDLFGGLNVVMTSASVLLILISYRGQSAFIKRQLKADERRDVENNFYQVLSSFRNFVAGVDLKTEKDEVRGVEAFRGMHDEVVNIYAFFKEHGIKFLEESLEKEINEFKINGDFNSHRFAIAVNQNNCLNKLKERYSVTTDVVVFSYLFKYYYFAHDLSLYFRLLYRIIDNVDSSHIDDTNKWLLIKVVRSSISDFELLLIFYNVISPLGRDFKPLCEKYAFFDNLDYEDVIEYGLLGRLSKTAYCSKMARNSCPTGWRRLLAK